MDELLDGLLAWQKQMNLEYFTPLKQFSKAIAHVK